VTPHGVDVAAVVDRLVADKVASRLGAKDATLWGPDAEPEASIRLGWTDLHETSRPLLAQIEALFAELRAEGLDRIVLAGMGGSSLAPEVITRTAGVELTVLDTTDPAPVRRALGDRLDRTVLVVSSKSGSTVETDSQRRVFEAAFAEAGIDAASRIVAVTDPGSALAEHAQKSSYRGLFLADPNVGGRYSALTAFGLVPSGLAGADIAGLLDEAAAVADLLTQDSPDNPALVLGAAMSGFDGAAPASGDAGFERAAGEVGHEHGHQQAVAEPLRQRLAHAERFVGQHGHQQHRPFLQPGLVLGRLHLFQAAAVRHAVIARRNVQRPQCGAQRLLVPDPGEIGLVILEEAVDDEAGDEHQHRRQQDGKPQRRNRDHDDLPVISPCRIGGNSR
jgi:hypothetical protein